MENSNLRNGFEERMSKILEKSKNLEEKLVSAGWEYRTPQVGDLFAVCPRDLEDPSLWTFSSYKHAGMFIVKHCKLKKEENGTYSKVDDKDEVKGTEFRRKFSKGSFKNKDLVFLCAPPVEKPSEKKESLVLKSVTPPDGGIAIADYSEKAFVVTGNTKPIKETLKKLGGKFNPRLTCGCGWVFSKKKRENVKKALHLA